MQHLDILKNIFNHISIADLQRRALSEQAAVNTFLQSKYKIIECSNSRSTYFDVIVDRKTGLIMDSDFVPIIQTLDEHLFWNPTLKPKFIRELRSLRLFLESKISNILSYSQQLKSRYENLVRLEQNTEYIYLMHSFGWYPYGHLHDTLQRAYWFRDSNVESYTALCSKPRRLIDFGKHLKAVGITKYLTPKNLPAVFRVPVLHYGENVAPLTTFTQESYDWMLKGYKKLFAQTNTCSTPKKIYITRNHIKKDKRGVLNELEVVNFLKSKNFTIVNGSEDLETIYNYFSNAQIVVSAHGSGLVNTIFCTKSCRIIEYCPRNRVDYSFKNKLKAAEKFYHVIVDADENCNIKIDLANLNNMLEYQ